MEKFRCTHERCGCGGTDLRGVFVRDPAVNCTNGIYRCNAFHRAAQLRILKDFICEDPNCKCSKKNFAPYYNGVLYLCGVAKERNIPCNQLCKCGRSATEIWRSATEFLSSIEYKCEDCSVQGNNHGNGR